MYVARHLVVPLQVLHWCKDFTSSNYVTDVLFSFQTQSADTLNWLAKDLLIRLFAYLFLYTFLLITVAVA